MDEQVLRSLIKWPKVPACFGWLALDRRGQWRMRDEYAQQNHLPGQVITHRALNDFIARNYASDSLGRFFFQNGPQRVFVTLSATPWIVRIIPGETSAEFRTQCNTEMIPNGALCDELGNIYITGLIDQTIYPEAETAVPTTEKIQSVALLHDHDLDEFSRLSSIHEQSCSFAGRWNWKDEMLPLEPIISAELSDRFKYQQHVRA
jgi:hypothetical protein